MHTFYRDTISLVLILMLATIVGVYLGYSSSHVKTSLTPLALSDIQWWPFIEAKDQAQGASLTVTSLSDVIDYQLFLPEKQATPYTAYTFQFGNKGDHSTQFDLSAYDSINFSIACAPQNVLLFNLFTHDKVTQQGDPDSQRTNSIFLSCDSSWKAMEVGVKTLDTPDWWINKFGLELSDDYYDLTRAYRFSIVNSLQSPRGITSHVRVKDVELRGRKYGYLYASLLLVAMSWAGAIFYISRRYFNHLILDVKKKVKGDKQIIAYKELTITPQKNKETSDVLRFMATRYADGELSLESACKELGINRTKINDILRAELDLTFNTYLNKLRITEAARLLTENKCAAIAEIAYAVGYNNVSYFSKLFKAEYNCTPKTFKQLYSEEQ